MDFGRCFRVNWHALHDVVLELCPIFPAAYCHRHNRLVHAPAYPAADRLWWLSQRWWYSSLACKQLLHVMFFSDKSRKETPGDVYMCVCHLLLLSEIFGWLVWGRGCHCFAGVTSMGEGVLWGWVNQYQCCLWMRCWVAHYPWILFIDINM